MNTKQFICLTAGLLMAAAGANAQKGRTTISLSQNNWSIWLDTAAKWQNDKLYARPPAIKQLPVNLPTGGWAQIESTPVKTAHLPATVEEYFWGANGSKFGVTGNYLGVSWFSTKFMVPATLKGKHLRLQFESVRFRAEVFVNHKLVGYDLITGTPFDVDISDAAKPGQLNELAVRITDPNGNFDWRDSQNFMWGDYRTQPTHGFGGISGKVLLTATDNEYIDDVFVKNTPQTDKVHVEISLKDKSEKAPAGDYLVTVKEFKTGKVVYSKVEQPTSNVHGFDISITGAALWDTEHPNLYVLTANWRGKDGSADSFSRRFGFRWFEVRDVKGDQQFYLNNKRIVLRTAISWGFWAVNGLAPTDELARRQVADAKRIGLNMLNFHRTIGQPNVLDAADELGLLYFEEPGGNQFPENLFQPKDELGQMQRDYYFPAREEKFYRMVKRDRNHPSLVIYNMHNERGAEPQDADKREMLNGHRLDNSRIMTYNSSNGPIKMNEPDPRFKMHLFPFDTTFYNYGWFDQHHAGGPGVYHDALYNNPTDYAKYTDHKNEIIYYGEEGAIGTPPRLQLIREEILKTGVYRGWETDTYLKWYDAYDTFLKKYGFTKAFPNVDSLTRKMGNVAYYYQGRVIENVRINNIIDGYAINGWESMKQENHSGVVDDYRHLKGDPDLIARYNQPLFASVKLNHKVVATGNVVIADFYIVNEKNISGAAELNVKVWAGGKLQFEKVQPVKITGGSTYGELLLQGMKIEIRNAGYTKVTAEIKQNGHTVCTGSDEVFAVKVDKSGIDKELLVADTTGVMQKFLTAEGIKFGEYKSGKPAGHTLLVGDFNPQETGNPLVTNLLEWVNNGNTLVVAANTEKWAAYLAKKEVVDSRGIQVMGTSWYGGNYFVKQHPLFAGLPQSCVFNWEYQCLATYNKNRFGMRLFSGNPIVGCVSDHKQEVYSALSVITLGRGRIILSALDILSCLKAEKAVKRAEGDGENASMNSFNGQAANPANVVAQQLLFNMLKRF